MFRNSHNSRGSSTHVKNAAPRWRGLFIALVLALSIGSVSQTAPAQAAPAATEFGFKLKAKKDKGNATVCVGDQVRISVQVTREEYVGNKVSNRQNVPGILVDASMSNKIGSLSPSSSETGWKPIKPGTANFILAAEKAGTTTITFKGTITQIWWWSKLVGPLEVEIDFVEDQLNIKVEDCEYKVDTYSRWVQNGGYFTVIAMINGGGMKVDEQGQYSGTASVDWGIIPNLSLSGCTMGAMVIPSSEAKLYGDIDGSDLYVVVTFTSVTYKPVEIACPNLPGSPSGSASSAFKVSPEPMTRKVPYTGGSSEKPQGLTNFPSGNGLITVTRVTGQ
jgi:hypothetical protein